MIQFEAEAIYNKFCKKCKNNNGLSRSFINCNAKERLVFLDFNSCDEFDKQNTVAEQYSILRKNMFKSKKLAIK